MYVSFVCLKSILFRVVQVFMFDVAFVPLPPVYFSPHVDDGKVDIWIVCYDNLDHIISHVLTYSISSCALYSSLQECFKHKS